ncbi:hypothetical protein Salat_2138100 [Sesamum alatum]|uniref:Uncharacterized protein n=1 Tax=Sesamum alatum TaxID=300844 RepID=A0AAE1Y1C1_9LAMI|nr:hypothetical protein Salat_2138100 [Sesamum alatum]
MILDKCSEQLGYVGQKKYFMIDMLKKFREVRFETDLCLLVDGHGREVNVYIDGVKQAAEIEGGIVVGDKGKNVEVDEGLVHNVKDKGKGKLIEEGGNGQGSDWVDWDMNEEHMNDYQLDSEDDEFDVDDSVDYSKDDEYFDNNIDKEVKWGGFENQQEEVPVNEDCPPISQPEDAIQQDAELPTTKKLVRRAIFVAEVEPEPVPSTMHFYNVNPKPAPAPPPMHPKLNIRAPPPMVGHPPGFVSKPITGKHFSTSIASQANSVLGSNSQAFTGPVMPKFIWTDHHEGW